MATKFGQFESSAEIYSAAEVDAIVSGGGVIYELSGDAPSSQVLLINVGDSNRWARLFEILKTV